MSPVSRIRRYNSRFAGENVGTSVRLKILRSENYAQLKEALTRKWFVDLVRLPKNCSLVKKTLSMPLLDYNGPSAFKEENQPSKKESLMVPGWFEQFDQKTELILCLLLIQDNDLFIKYLFEYKNEFSKKRLLALVNLMVTMDYEYLFSLLQQALTAALRSKTKVIVVSLIINLLIYAVRDKKLEPLTPFMLNLIRNNNLKPWNEKILCLSRQVLQEHIFLLVVDLLISDDDLSRATDMMCQNAGPAISARRHELPSIVGLHSDTLIRLLRFIQTKDEPQLAYKLAAFYFSKNVLPTQTRLWSSLALTIMLSNEDTDEEEIAEIVVKMIKRNIQVPETLLRASLIRLGKPYLKSTFYIFENAITYSRIVHSLTKPGPMRNCVKLDFGQTWCMTEYQIAFLWACNQVKRKRGNASFEIHFYPVIKPTEEGLEIEIEHLNVSTQYEQSNSVQRLLKSLRGLDPPVRGSCFPTGAIFLDSASLSSYFSNS